MSGKKPRLGPILRSARQASGPGTFTAGDALPGHTLEEHLMNTPVIEARPAAGGAEASHLTPERSVPSADAKTWSAVASMGMCVAMLIAAEFMPVSLLTPIARDLG